MASASAASPNDPFEQLSRIVHAERAALLAAAVRAGLSAEEGLECVQDALCAWLVQSQRERERPVASELLIASLKHRVRNLARNARRRHRRSLPHASVDPTREPTASTADAEQLLSSAESSLRLKVCVAELRDVERAVVTLRLLEERSGEDVAHALGLSRAHVDVLVHRAKATLRVCMLAPECAGS